MHRLIIVAVMAGCSGAGSAVIGNRVERAGSLYEALFRQGQTWEFPVTVVDHPHAGDPDTAETLAGDPVRCAVTSVEHRGAARRARITCTTSDELMGYPPPSHDLDGTYVATPDGLWKLLGATDPDHIVTTPADTKLLPASPAGVRREGVHGPCLDDELAAHVVTDLDPDRMLYALTRWGSDAWCVTTVWGCHSTWSIQCFRAADGWIGGASRGYFDPATPHWTEVRWGQAPAFPFGVSK